MDLPGSNSLSNLQGLTKVVYGDKPKRKYNKIKNLFTKSGSK